MEDIDELRFFFFKQKTAYEIGTGDWSSDVCSSDLVQYVQIGLWYGTVTKVIQILSSHRPQGDGFPFKFLIVSDDDFVLF